MRVLMVRIRVTTCANNEGFTNSSRVPDGEEPLFGGTPFRDAHGEDQTTHDDDSRVFYSLLNVDKDATEEQIRDAYKTLAGKLLGQC